jgi:hypothetical protein
MLMAPFCALMLWLKAQVAAAHALLKHKGDNKWLSRTTSKGVAMRATHAGSDKHLATFCCTQKP